MLRTLILAAGLAQLVVVLAGACVPAILRWRAQLACLRPLTRQVFWTYGGYVLATHVAFAGLALVLPDALIDGSPLAACVTGFVCLWWSTRLLLQLFCFDRRDHPPGRLVRLGEAFLVTLFALLGAAYGLLCAANLAGGAR